MYSPTSAASIYVIGSGTAKEGLIKEVKGFDVGTVVDCESGLPKQIKHPAVVLGAANFEEPAELQQLGRKMIELDNVSSNRIIFISNPLKPSKAEILWTIEVGAQNHFYGDERLEELKRHLSLIEASQNKLSDIETAEERMHRLYANGDSRGLEKLAAEVAVYRDTERGLRLQANIQQRLGKKKRHEALLRTLLMKFPENLWAANRLGKLYLSQHRTSEGVEVLEKLSFFHDLEGERLLALGDAYVHTGQVAEAERVFQKGLKLDDGDERFQNGMAKVSMAKNNIGDAQKWLGESNMNSEVLSFLNMRAVLAVKQEQYKEGMDLYRYAIEKTDNELLSAKLWFNFGLAFVRQSDPEKALPCFETSLKLGGEIFRRAEGPLVVLKKVVAKLKKTALVEGSEEEWKELNEIDWEQVN